MSDRSTPIREEASADREGNCPHCGGEAQSFISDDKIHPYRIICKACGCSTAHHGDYRAAWASWIRRPPSLNINGDVGAAITKAIGDADDAFGYSFNMVRLVEGVATHRLIMDGFDPVDFEEREDGYRLIAERRNKLRASAVLSAIRSTDPLPASPARISVSDCHIEGDEACNFFRALMAGKPASLTGHRIAPLPVSDGLADPID